MSSVPDMYSANLWMTIASVCHSRIYIPQEGEFVANSQIIVIHNKVMRPWSNQGSAPSSPEFDAFSSRRSRCCCLRRRRFSRNVAARRLALSTAGSGAAGLSPLEGWLEEGLRVINSFLAKAKRYLARPRALWHGAPRLSRPTWFGGGTELGEVLFLLFMRSIPNLYLENRLAAVAQW